MGILLTMGTAYSILNAATLFSWISMGQQLEGSIAESMQKTSPTLYTRKWQSNPRRHLFIIDGIWVDGSFRKVTGTYQELFPTIWLGCKFSTGTPTMNPRKMTPSFWVWFMKTDFLLIIRGVPTTLPCGKNTLVKWNWSKSIAKMDRIMIKSQPPVRVQTWSIYWFQCLYEISIL